MDDLEGQLIRVRHLLRRLLQGEEFIGAEVSFVIGGGCAGQDGLAKVVIVIAHSASCVAVELARSTINAGRLACLETACQRPPRFTQTSVIRNSPALSLLSPEYCW